MQLEEKKRTFTLWAALNLSCNNLSWMDTSENKLVSSVTGWNKNPKLLAIILIDCDP